MRKLLPALLLTLAACGGGAGQPTTADSKTTTETIDPQQAAVQRWDAGVQQWNALSDEEKAAWHAKGDGYNGFKVWAAAHGHPTEMP